MEAEMNVYPLGQLLDFDIQGESRRHTKYEDYSMHNYGDVVFQKTTSKNMDKLWAHFHKNKNYPEFYRGIAKRMAICKCPDTGEEEWFNGERCLSVPDPVTDSTVTVTLKMKDKTYTKDFVFKGWVKFPVHEWAMGSGTTLQLSQSFVDGLLPVDKKYLKMNH
jgi:hypothetical protein